MNSPSVSWDTYAQKYDMLMNYNPFYQKLHQQVIEQTQHWQIAKGDRVLDLGAGTGNYSIALAQKFPQANVLHVDKDLGMNAVARKKMKSIGIQNLEIKAAGIEEIEMPAASLRAVISIHALYAFPDPVQALHKIYNWLEPGGEALLVDAGRVVNVLNWQLVLAWHLLKNYGLTKTLQLFKEGKEVSKQNAYIRKMQRDGIFWTHSYETFVKTVQEIGFELQDGGTTFRGVSDWVLVRKQR